MPPQALWLTTTTSPPRRCSSTAARSPAAPLPTTTQPWRWTGSAKPADVDRLRARPAPAAGAACRRRSGHRGCSAGHRRSWRRVPVVVERCHRAGGVRRASRRMPRRRRLQAGGQEPRKLALTQSGMRCRSEAAGLRIAAGPDPRLEPFDAGRAVLVEDMGDVEARPSDVGEAAGDRHPIAMGTGCAELGPRRHQRPAERCRTPPPPSPAASRRPRSASRSRRRRRRKTAG